ncbi:MAG: DUF3488 domain-containing transglutaminase family protein [Proteobacteria bacterium]|nr:DUF3488 domain-containing transglutaminase family protein [Pseudomonadota bacterium]
MSERVRLEQLRRGFVRGLVLLGLAALVLLGDGGVQLGLAGLALVSGAWAFTSDKPRRRVWAVASAVVAVATLITPILLSIPWAWAGMALLVYLQVHRARIRQDTRDDRLSLLFALLMVLLASTTARSPLLALIFGGLVLAMPIALVLLHVVELERGRAARSEPLAARGRLWKLLALGPATLFATAFFFAVIPRLNTEVLSSFGEEQDISGFDDGVQLGDIGEIKDNPQLVMRVEVTNELDELQAGPFYFRGVALDEFDGRIWSASDGSRISVARPLSEAPATPPSGMLRQRIQLEPIRDVPAFAIAPVWGVFSDDAVRRTRRSDLRISDDPRRREYIVVSDVRGELHDHGSRAYADASVLSVPLDLDPRIDALADQIVGERQAPRAKAAAIEQYLRDNYDYTLIPTGSNSDEPLSSFLFDSKEGHCEYFATALAVLLRAEGVPTRLVNGFYGGDYNALGGFIAVRQAHAHSWVEVWIVGEGWVRFDATPASALPETAGGPLAQLNDAIQAQWYGLVLDYDLNAQIDGARTIGRLARSDAEAVQADGPPSEVLGFGMLLLGGLVAVVAGSAFVRRWLVGRARRPRGVQAVHARARALVARRGWSIPRSMPPVEGAQWLREQAGVGAAPLERLAWLMYRVRYAEAPEAESIGPAKAALAELKQSLEEARS